MDVQLIAIAAAIILVVVILLSCFLIFGTRERSFEDALAQQKGLGILLSDRQGKIEKHKDKHKTHEGWKKKSQNQKITNEQVAVDKRSQSKEKSGSKSKMSTAVEEVASNSKKDSSKRRNDDIKDTEESVSSTSITRQESSSDHSEKPETKQSGTKKGGKKNKREASPDDVVVAGQGQQEELHPQDPPAGLITDEQPEADQVDAPIIEIQESEVANESATQIPATQTTKKNAKKKQKAKLADNDLHQIKSETTTKKAVDDDTGDERKPVHNVSDDGNLDAIIEGLKVSSLSHGQIEFVVNALLNRQEQWNPAHSTTQKSDQLTALKKQLEDKEKALAHETQLATGLNKKIKELCQESSTDKSRIITIERTYNEQLATKQRDIQTLQQKIQELNSQMGQLTNQVVTYRKHMDKSPNPSQLQQLHDEVHHLKEHLTRNEQESHVHIAEIQRFKQEAVQRDSQLKQAEQQNQQLEQRLNHLQQNLGKQDATLKQLAVTQQELTVAQQELEAKKLAYTQLEKDTNELRKEWTSLEPIVRSMRQQQQQPLKEQNISLKSDGSIGNEELKSSNEQLSRDLLASQARVAELEKRLSSDAESRRQSSQLQTELRQAKEQLESVHKERQQADAWRKEAETLTNKTKALEAETARLQSSTDESSKKMKKLQENEENLRQQLQAEIASRQMAEKTLESLKNNVSQLEEAALLQKAGASADSQDTVIVNLRKDVNEWQQRAIDFEEKVKQSERDHKKVADDRRQQETKIEALMQENLKLKAHSSHAANGHMDSASVDALKVQEISLTHLNKQLITKDGELAQLKQQLDQQRQKNSELRERNQKVVEAMNQLEKTSKDVLHNIEIQHQKELTERERNAKQALSKVLAQKAPVPEKETFGEWLNEFIRVLDSVVATSSKKTNQIDEKKTAKSSSSGDSDLKQQNSELQSELARYKTVLIQTETALRSLEDSASKHEAIWSERVSKLEKELSQAKECKSVDLTSRSASNDDSSQKELNAIRVTLENMEKDNLALQNDIERARSELALERTGSRDLSSQVVKLRGMLKTGQDALKQEQDLVAKLQQQFLASSQEISSSPPDVIKAKGDQHLQEECRELRNKLAHREQQLEREMMINTQLNDKLVSLGLTLPTGAVGNGSL